MLWEAHPTRLIAAASAAPALDFQCSSEATRRYQYSKQAGGEWHKVTVDLEYIAKGVDTNEQGIVVAPEPVKVELPTFVMEYLGKRDLKYSTVIIVEKPDRLNSGYRKPNNFHKTMLEHLGLVYRQSLRNRDLRERRKSAGC